MSEASYPTHRRMYDPQPTPVSDRQKELIAAWLREHNRTCPNCNCPADQLEAVDLRMQLNAVSGEPIDTSDETEVVRIRCRQCGFDRMDLPTDEVW